MIGRPGVDSSSPVTTEKDDKTLPEIAKDLFGRYPSFWGRYFTSIHTPGNTEYRHLHENLILHDSGIRVLPIGRNTAAVGGSKNQGINDARMQVDDLLATFDSRYLAGQGGRFFLFLDVEFENPLSVSYYSGWATTVIELSRSRTRGAVEIRPCVYASQGDTPTWEAIATAEADGIPCDGAWVAHWLEAGPNEDTSKGCLALPEWDEEKVTPPVPLICPVLIWQYSSQCRGWNGFDCNQTNPNLNAGDILRFLILPPGSEAEAYERVHSED
jgi:hypothetical protein